MVAIVASPATTISLLLLLASLLFCISNVSGQEPTNVTVLVDDERERCGEILDMHLHPSNYTTVDPLLMQMDQAGISRGILYAVYASNNSFLPDANLQVEGMIQESGGRMYGLASLDTSGDWEETRDFQLGRLLEYLEKPEFVGTKLAPPHTCLELNGTILRDVIEAVSLSSIPVVGIHTGTTPFCGPFGELILGYRGCCQEQYVDPTYLVPLVTQYPNVTFILLHTGFDFLPPTDEFFYNASLVDNAIEVAVEHENVWLEISALFPEEPDGRPRNPTGGAVVQAIKDAGLANRVFYGSDANFPGVMTTALEWAVPAMIDAGFTEEERCSALVDASLNVCGIPPLENTTPTSSSSPNGMLRFSTLLWMLAVLTGCVLV